MLLEFIEASALCRNAEVSLAALKSFQEILQITRHGGAGGDEDLSLLLPDTATNGIPHATAAEQAQLQEKATKIDDVVLWSNAWRVWLCIGTKVTVPPDTKSSDTYVPSQPFLTALIQIFPPLFEHIKQRFVASDLQKLNTVLQGALSVPVQGDASPFIVPTTPDVQVTTLQEAVLNAVDVLQKVDYFFSA